MDSQYFVEYKIVDATNKAFITQLLEEAIGYFQEGWTVYEHHRMVVIVSKFTSSSQTVTIVWNGNPVLERRYKK